MRRSVRSCLAASRASLRSRTTTRRARASSPVSPPSPPRLALYACQEQCRPLTRACPRPLPPLCSVQRRDEDHADRGDGARRRAPRARVLHAQLVPRRPPERRRRRGPQGRARRHPWPGALGAGAGAGAEGREK